MEIPELSAGTHRLVVRSSDIYGNQGSSTITLRSGTGLQIAGLSAIPSPFETSTHIRFVLSESAGEAHAHIYTVSGRLIRRLSGGAVIQGTNLMPWDGRDEDGDRIAGGVYFLRLEVSGENGKATAQTKIVKRAS
jgi:flagellar hook assembly protein FlgD